MFTGRCGCLQWVEQLGAGLASVAVKPAALIWKLARKDFLTVGGKSDRLLAVDYVAFPIGANTGPWNAAR